MALGLSLIKYLKSMSKIKTPELRYPIAEIKFFEKKNKITQINEVINHKENPALRKCKIQSIAVCML